MHGFLARARSTFRGLWRRRQLDTEIDEELRFHLERRAEDLRRVGMSPAEATRHARLQFGSTDRYKEEGTDARGLRFFDALRSDLRFALRTLRRSPGFAAVAILTLGLGIGANSAIFSVVHGVLLKPLPFQDAERLYAVGMVYPDGTVYSSLSAPDFMSIREESRALARVDAYANTRFTLLGLGAPRRYGA